MGTRQVDVSMMETAGASNKPLDRLGPAPRFRPVNGSVGARDGQGLEKGARRRLPRCEGLCYCPYDGEHVWYPGVRDSSEASWISVGTDSAVALSIDLPTEPARIEGEITGAWLDLGRTLPPELALISPDSMTIMGPRVVGDDGSFGVNIHLPGPVRLRVTQDGVEQWIGGPTFEEATTFDLEMGETISGVELVQCGMRLSVDAPVRNLGGVAIRFYDPVSLTLVTTYSSGSELSLIVTEHSKAATGEHFKCGHSRGEHVRVSALRRAEGKFDPLAAKAGSSLAGPGLGLLTERVTS
jgi:hypothetical protein